MDYELEAARQVYKIYKEYIKDTNDDIDWEDFLHHIEHDAFDLEEFE